MSGQPRNQEPKKTEKNLKEVPQKKNAFVISPIGEAGTPEHKKFQQVLTYIFKAALDESEWNVRRADESNNPDSINGFIVNSISSADLVLADLTGHNPNVFYELAIAHGFKRPVVHVASTGQSLPFDVIDQRAIFYDIHDLDSVNSAITSIRAAVTHLMDGTDDIINPLSSFEAFSTLKSSGSTSDPNNVLISMLSTVNYRLGRLEKEILENQQVLDASDKRRAPSRYDRSKSYTNTLRLLNTALSLAEENGDVEEAERLAKRIEIYEQNVHTSGKLDEPEFKAFKH